MYHLEDAIRAGAASHAYDAILEVVLPVMNTMHGAGRFDESIAFGRFAMELPGGSLRNKTALAPDYALALYSVGRAKEALSVIAAAAGAAPLLGSHEREIFVAQQIMLDTKLGLVDHARSLIDEFANSREAGAFMQLAFGHFHEQHGDPEAARRALEADLESPVRAHPVTLRYALLALARIALRTDDAALMERALRRLRKFRGTGEVNDACLAWCEAYAMARSQRHVAENVNEVWSMDLMHGRLADAAPIACSPLSTSIRESALRSKLLSASAQKTW